MKQLLLFMTDFYGYNNEIISEIKKQGYSVTWYLDEVVPTNFDRLKNKLQKNYLANKFDEYFSECLFKEQDSRFDVILIIFGGNFFQKKHLETLKNSYPKTPIIYYAWDSVKNFPKIGVLLEMADFSFTFDQDDAERFHVNHLPLFYTQRTDNTVVTPKFDVSTVMTFFFEKWNSLSHALDEIPEDITSNFFIRFRDKAYYYRILFLHYFKTKEIRKYAKFDSLSRSQVIKMFMESKTVLDCPLPNQSGLTMRTFEVLALNRKLITTNKNVKCYDFYSDDNIYIINSGRTDIYDFIQTPFNLSKCLDEKYSISNFVKTLLAH